MTTQSFLLLAVFLLVLGAAAWPLGGLLARVADGRNIPGLGWLAAVEKLLYRAAGVQTDEAQRGMGWKAYAIALLVFNLVGTLFVYAVQRMQAWLPLNPQDLPGASPDSSFNTAVSFVANTNWQGYAGEQTMSYLSQMLALTGQNFFGRHRHCRGIRPDPRLRCALRQIDRQLLGRPDPHRAVCAVAVVLPVCSVPGWPGCDPELLRLQGGSPAGAGDLRDTGCYARSSSASPDREHAVDRHGPGRLAGSDQDVGHQRRWLFQRQLRASL